MKHAILALVAFAAMSSIQAPAAAFDNLPEPTTGSGGSPNGTTRSESGSTDALRTFDLSGTAASDASDEASVDNMPEANVGDGSRPD